MGNRVRHQCGSFMTWDALKKEWYCQRCYRAWNRKAYKLRAERDAKAAATSNSVDTSDPSVP